MKEVVWVVGKSAAGKETFIRTVPLRPAILEQLGWSGKTLTPCAESMDYIGQYDDDPRIALREEILHKVPLLLRSVEVVLIKWQHVDSQASRPQRLKALLPDARHRIVQLRAPMPELIERLTEKPWWHDYGKEEQSLEVENQMIQKSFQELGDDFEVITLGSGSAEDYAVIDQES